MAMICPQCQSQYREQTECPTCGVRLVYQQSRASIHLPPIPDGDDWQQTPWGRILVGILLSQGLYQGLWQFILAAQSALGDEASVGGLFLRQAIQLFSLLLGGMIAGAGLRRGPAYGALVGVGSSVLFLLVEAVESVRNGNGIPIVPLYSQPLLQGLCGTFGGLLGIAIWKPLPATIEAGGLATPDFPEPAALGDDVPVRPTLLTAAGRAVFQSEPEEPSKTFSGPLDWGWVFTGIIIAVLGTMFAEAILSVLVSMAEVKVKQQVNQRLLTWEIVALAMFGGAAVAAAGKENGPKHGVMVGFLTGCTLLLLNNTVLSGQRQILSHMLLFDLLEIVPKRGSLIETGGYTLIMTSLLGLAGGYFGFMLLPPTGTSRTKQVKLRVKAL